MVLLILSMRGCGQEVSVWPLVLLSSPVIFCFWFFLRGQWSLLLGQLMSWDSIAQFYLFRPPFLSLVVYVILSLTLGAFPTLGRSVFLEPDNPDSFLFFFSFGHQKRFLWSIVGIDSFQVPFSPCIRISRPIPFLRTVYFPMRH